MKPKNFPERKRQRQQTALTSLVSNNGNVDAVEFVTLINATEAGDRRHVRTKINRSSQGRRIK